MPLHQIRLSTVIIAMVITLGLLLGGQYSYEKYIVKEELSQKIAQIVEIDEIKIEKNENPPTVYIRASQITDLPMVNRRLGKIIREELGPEYRLVFLDQRTPRLQDLYENCQFSIQEAITAGNFQEMHQAIQKKAAAEHVDYKVSVDSYNVYLQLRDQKGYLYEIIPRWPQLAINGD